MFLLTSSYLTVLRKPHLKENLEVEVGINGVECKGLSNKKIFVYRNIVLVTLTYPWSSLELKIAMQVKLSLRVSNL